MPFSRRELLKSLGGGFGFLALTGILLVLVGRNSESPVPVLAASTPGNCFFMAIEACRIAVRYMTPVILLSDNFIANGAEPWKIPALADLVRPARGENVRLTAGRHGRLFRLLDSALPVIAEAHRARGLLHLGLAPGEVAVGERDQLLRRIGDHVVAEVGDETFPAARLALDVRRVGAERRPGRNDLGLERDIGLRAPLDIEIIHLRVARQAKGQVEGHSGGAGQAIRVCLLRAARRRSGSPRC